MHARSLPQFCQHRSIFLALLIAGLLAPSARAGASSDGPLDAQEEIAFRQATRAVSPSLVRIQTVGGVDRVAGRLAGTAATTGVVVSDDGWIVSSAFNFISKPQAHFGPLG